MKRSSNQRPSQRAVRVGTFERTMDGFNAEISVKMAQAIGEYHTTFVEPRLAWIELPWYGKLWARLRRSSAWTDLKAALKLRDGEDAE